MLTWLEYCIGMKLTNKIGIGGNASKHKDEFASGENVSNSDDALAELC